MFLWYVYQAFAMAFVGHYLSFPCAPLHSCVLPRIPVHSRAFDMHRSRPISDIIRQFHAFLCVRYGPEPTSVGDTPILCVIDGTDFPLSDIHFSCEFAMSESPCLYGEFI